MIFDSGLDDTQDIVSFVATDNYHGGQIGRPAGWASCWVASGRVIVLRYTVGSQSSELREDGCLDVLKKEFPDIEIISSNQYGGDTADKALVKPSRCCSTLAIKVDGVFTPTQHVSTGMLRALEEQGLAGKVKFIGFDAGPELVAALQGRQDARHRAARSGRMAELAVTTLAAHVRGEAGRAANRHRRNAGHAGEHGRARDQAAAESETLR